MIILELIVLINLLALVILVITFTLDYIKTNNHYHEKPYKKCFLYTLYIPEFFNRKNSKNTPIFNVRS